MDKLTAMRTFVAVVNAGGFSSAAQALAVPKTRISQRIQDLEAALSTRLLYRTTRVVSLTEEGRIYFEKCNQILDEIDTTEQALSGVGEVPSGRLRVSSLSQVARVLLLPRLAEFYASYPNVSLTLSASDRIENLNEAGLDCAIRGGSLESSTLISRHICDVSFGLFASPDWVRKNTQLKNVGDLGSAELIKVLSQRDGAARDWELTGPDGTVKIDRRARLEIDDDQAALDAALGGVGIALCADFAALPHVAEGRLCRVFPELSASSRPIYAIYPTRRYLSAKLRCFLDWVETVFGS